MIEKSVGFCGVKCISPKKQGKIYKQIREYSKKMYETAPQNVEKVIDNFKRRCYTK